MLGAVPVLALCFERERDGRVRQYGMWPCLMGGKATMPHLGVFPGLLLIVAMALITLLHDPSYVEALGVFLTIGGMCVFAAETLAVATMLASDTDPFASVGVCAVVALPALAVIGLILIFSDEATALREYIDQDAAVRTCLPQLIPTTPLARTLIIPSPARPSLHLT